MSEAKDDFIARTVEVWNPGKTLQWQRDGIDLVIDRREGYYLYDMDGRRLIDLHLNGGTYSLGHRNPGGDRRRAGGHGPFRHRQPPLPRADAHRSWPRCSREHTPEGLQYSMFGSGGGEAIDIALKSARHATQAAAAHLHRSAAITAIPASR